MQRLTCENGWLYLQCDYYFKERAKKAPGWRWAGAEKGWEYPFNESVIAVLKRVFPSLILSPELDMELERRAKERKIIEQIKNGKYKPNNLSFQNLRFKKPTKEELPPYGYQYRAFQEWDILFGLYKGSHGNFNHMGTGKTFHALVQAQHYIDTKQIDKMLVVSPKTVTYNWEDETVLWGWLDPLVVSGTAQKRRQLLKSEYNDIFVLNYDILRLHARELEHMFTKYKMLLVLDEIHKIKNQQALRTKAIFRLSPRFIIGLSGTPIMNQVEDIFSSIQLLTDKRMWRNIWDFRQWHCNIEVVRYQGRKVHQVTGYKNLPELKRRIDPICVRRIKKEVLPWLKDKEYLKHYVDLLPEQRRKYEITRDQYIQEWTASPHMTGAKRLQVMTQVIRLLQLTDGFQQDKKAELLEYYPSAKEELIKELLEEFIEKEGKRIVLYSLFVPPIFRLAETFKKYNPLVIWGGVKDARERLQKAKMFSKSPHHPLLIAQQEAAGEGLNYVAEKEEVYGIFVNRHPSPGVGEQAEDRMHRGTTVGTVFIIDILARNTINEKRFKKLGGKYNNISQVIRTGDIKKLVELV